MCFIVSQKQTVSGLRSLRPPRMGMAEGALPTALAESERQYFPQVYGAAYV